jgi:hypothetical protein
MDMLCTYCALVLPFWHFLGREMILEASWVYHLGCAHASFSCWDMLCDKNESIFDIRRFMMNGMMLEVLTEVRRSYHA